MKELNTAITTLLANGMQDITFKGDVFIIPNRYDLFNNESYMSESQKKNIADMFTANGLTFDIHEDRVIQIWIVSRNPEDPTDPNYLNTDNFYDHGAKMKPFYITAKGSSVVPAKLFENLQEGETTTIKIPVYLEYRNSEELDDVSINTYINFELTARQRCYRYRQFGEFEEVFNKCI